MRIEPLESPDEQVASFDAIPLDSQVALLQHVLKDRDALARTVGSTVEAWLRGDLAALSRIAEATDRRYPAVKPHYAQLVKHLIHDRAIVMHYRVSAPLRAGGVFVAVGAMHIYGDKGLLAMLERDGYRISRIW